MCFLGPRKNYRVFECNDKLSVVEMCCTPYVAVGTYTDEGCGELVIIENVANSFPAWRNQYSVKILSLLASLFLSLSTSSSLLRWWPLIHIPYQCKFLLQHRMYSTFRQHSICHNRDTLILSGTKKPHDPLWHVSLPFSSAFATIYHPTAGYT